MSAHPTLLELRLVDHLSASSLQAALAPLTARCQSTTGRCVLLVDCTRMTGYDGAARSHFVDWNRAHKERIDRVAIVTSNLLWHMVVGAMSLASRQSMKPFSVESDARRWLDEA